MCEKDVVAAEDREIIASLIERKVTLGEISDASLSAAGLFLLDAFAWARKPAWTTHEIVASGGVGRGCVRGPACESCPIVGNLAGDLAA